jgi:hypothetical protein
MKIRRERLLLCSMLALASCVSALFAQESVAAAVFYHAPLSGTLVDYGQGASGECVVRNYDHLKGIWLTRFDRAIARPSLASK